MAQVDWTEQAYEDLDAIFDLIARDSVHLAMIFTDRLLGSTDRLSQFPLSGRIVPEKQRDDLRELIVQSYRVVYRVRGDRVSVLAVLHGARALPEL